MGAPNIADFLWPDGLMGRQPSGFPGIDRTNSLVVGLEGLAYGPQGRNLVNNTPATSGSTPGATVVTTAGLGKNFSNQATTSYDTYAGVMNSPGNGYSLLAVVVFLAGYQTSSSLGIAGPNGSTGVNIKNASGKLRAAGYDSGGQKNALTTLSPVPGVPYAVLARATGSAIECWVNGQLLATAAMGTPLTPTANTFQVGACGGSAAEPNVQILMWAGWGRMITESEASSVTANPYQLFASSVPLFMPPSVSGAALATSTTAGASSTVSLTTSIAAAITEAWGASSTVALTTSISLAVSETAGVSSTVALTTGISAALAPTVGVNSSVSLTTAIPLGLTQTAGVASTVGLTTSIAPAVSETSGAASAVSLTTGIAAALAATVGASSSISLTVGAGLVVTGSSGATSAVALTTSITAAISGTAGASSSITFAGTAAALAPSSSSGVMSAVSFTTSIPLTVTSTAGAGSVAALTTAISLAASSTAGASSSVAFAGAGANLVLSSTVGVISTVTMGAAPVFAVTLYLSVPAEPRAMVVPVEDRELAVPMESRSFTV